MAQIKQTLTSATKGLLTEFSGLEFPEDASIDELNCVITSDNKKARREGIQFESNYSLSSFAVPIGTIVKRETWENVGGLSHLQFLVLQVGSTLRFYDKSVAPISSGEKHFTVNLQNFSAHNDKHIPDFAFQGSSLDGVFVVVHPGCNAFYIKYNPTNNTISTSRIEHRVRDFEWQGDTSTYFIPGNPNNAARVYDTWNAGWNNDAAVAHPLAKYQADRDNRLPPLILPWFSAKEPSGDDINNFKTYTFDKLAASAGNTLISNGHYILNFFEKNRMGLGVERESSRFSTVTTFGERFWYGGLESDKNGTKILFTSVIQEEADYGKCYQHNDPTSEWEPDLLDTDGGVISIPDAYGIVKLFPMGASLLIFARNGVWVLQGVDNIFKPTEFSISRVSETGVDNPNSFISAEGTPFWWSEYGIHTVEKDQVSSEPVIMDLTKETIQTFFDKISPARREQAIAEYDKIDKKIYWLYPSNEEQVGFKYNRILILDIPKAAFYPWKIEDQSSSTSYIVGTTKYENTQRFDTEDPVTVNGASVTVNNNQVLISTTQFHGSTVTQPAVKFIVRDGSTGRLTFADFMNKEFKDWGNANFESYFELGHAFFEDLTLYKSPVILTTYFEMTEEGFKRTGNEYSLINPSGCVVKSFWDFRTTPSSSQQAYRLKRLPVVDEENLIGFNYGNDTLINRTRLKGRGRNMRLRFESEEGKNFRMLGYELIGWANDGI